MGQRVVLRLNKYTMTAASMRGFLDTAEKLGFPPRGLIVYMQNAAGEPCLVAELPDRAAEALERAKRPREPTKARRAVTEQLQARAEAVKSGSTVPGHVPPVAKGGRVLKTRKKP